MSWSVLGNVKNTKMANQIKEGRHYRYFLQNHKRDFQHNASFLMVKEWYDNIRKYLKI